MKRFLSFSFLSIFKQKWCEFWNAGLISERMRRPWKEIMKLKLKKVRKLLFQLLKSVCELSKSGSSCWSFQNRRREKKKQIKWVHGDDFPLFPSSSEFGTRFWDPATERSWKKKWVHLVTNPIQSLAYNSTNLITDKT